MAKTKVIDPPGLFRSPRYANIVVSGGTHATSQRLPSGSVK